MNFIKVCYQENEIMMMGEETIYCRRLREERTFLSNDQEEQDSSSSSPSPSHLSIFTSYASSPSLFSPPSCFSLPLSSTRVPSFSLPLHPRTQIFLTRVLTELPQLKLHVSSVSSSSSSLSPSTSCLPETSSPDRLSCLSTSFSYSSPQSPSKSSHAVRYDEEKERGVLGGREELRERRDLSKTSPYTIEEKVSITPEKRANRYGEEEKEKEEEKKKKKVKLPGDVLSAVVIKIPEGLEEAILRQRDLTERQNGENEESSSSTREEREKEQEKGKQKEDERVTRIHVYGGFSLRVYIHLQTLLSTVGITTPWHEDREEGEEEEFKKNDEEREQATRTSPSLSSSSSSILHSFFSHLFLDFSLEIYSDYPFTSPYIFFHRILYREDEEYLSNGGTSSCAFLPLSEKIKNVAFIEIAAEDKQRNDSSSVFLRELASPSSRIFLSFLDQVIRRLEERLTSFSLSCSDNESLTHQVLGEEWTPSLSLVLLLRRLCSFVTLVYIQLNRDGAFHEKITTSPQDEEKDSPHPVHGGKNTWIEKKEGEKEGEGEDERSSKRSEARRRRQENGVSNLTQESNVPVIHAHHCKPWRNSHRQKEYFSPSSSSPPYPSSYCCLSPTSSPYLSSRESRRRCSPMICRLVRSSWRMRGACILLVWLAGVLLRASVGLYPYSGEGEIETGQCQRE